MRSAASRCAWEEPLRRGREREAAGDAAGAEASYRAALASSRGGSCVAVELARFLSDSGRLDEARGLLAAAVRAAPDETALVVAALLEERAGGRDAARRLLARAAVLFPESARPRFELGRLLERAGRGPAARRALRAALEREPGHPGALAALARLAGPGRRPAALRAAADAEFGPERFAARMELERFADAFADGEALLSAGRAPDAAVLWRPWDDGASDPVWRRRLAALARLRGVALTGGWAAHYACACRWYLGEFAAAARARLPSGPDRAWMRLWRGRARLMRLDLDGAAADFDAARRGSPTHWFAAAWLAEALTCGGRLDEALAVLDGARAQADRCGTPAYWRAWRGKLQLWAGRWDAAEPDLLRAHEGGSVYARTWLGAARLLSGRADAAARDLDAALAARPGDEETRAWAAEAALACGRARRARDVLGAQPPPSRATPWTTALRGLAGRAAGRDGAALAAWGALPPWARSLFGGGEVPRDDAGAARLLDAARARARGVRRHEAYAQEAWRRAR